MRLDQRIVNKITAKAQRKAVRTERVVLDKAVNRRQPVVDGAFKRHYDGSGNSTRSRYKEVS